MESHCSKPLRYQLNVWGIIFSFNEAGEVIYRRDGKFARKMYYQTVASAVNRLQQR